MTTRTRNMLIFPNTILNDVMSVSIRTAWPETPTKTRACIWNLAPVDEHPAVRSDGRPCGRDAAARLVDAMGSCASRRRDPGGLKT
jgi:hypothetical protein